MLNNRYLLIAGIVIALLLIPFIAMQFTSEVNWSLFDFAVAAILLFGTGFLIDMVIRKAKNVQNRYLLIVIILLLLFMVWAELAVGVFGTPFAGS
jgi:dipeptide/tripeptide permease